MPVTDEATVPQKSGKRAWRHSGLDSTSAPHHPKIYYTYQATLGNV